MLLYFGKPPGPCALSHDFLIRVDQRWKGGSVKQTFVNMANLMQIFLKSLEKSSTVNKGPQSIFCINFGSDLSISFSNNWKGFNLIWSCITHESYIICQIYQPKPYINRNCMSIAYPIVLFCCIILIKCWQLNHVHWDIYPPISHMNWTLGYIRLWFMFWIVASVWFVYTITLPNKIVATIYYLICLHGQE